MLHIMLRDKLAVNIFLSDKAFPLLSKQRIIHSSMCAKIYKDELTCKHQH